MSFNQIYYHIIFSTKDRKPTLPEEHLPELYRYIWGILKNKSCHLYRIGGTEDHLHMLISLHPTVCLSDLLRDLKRSSSHWAKEQSFFPNFIGWQREYGSYTVRNRDKDTIIEYIKNQKEHHQKESSLDEFKRILEEEGISYDSKYLE